MGKTDLEMFRHTLAILAYRAAKVILWEVHVLVCPLSGKPATPLAWYRAHEAILNAAGRSPACGGTEIPF